MDELIFAGNKYISSKRASKLTGYTADYIGQICRADKIECRLVGRNWYINERDIERNKKRFKKEQILSREEQARVNKYEKISPELLYYSNDKRSLNPEINKIHIEEDAEKVEENNEEKITIRVIKKPEVSIEKYHQPRIMPRIARPVAIRQQIAPRRQIYRRFPMTASAVFILMLIGALFTAGTLTLEQIIHYSYKDKTDTDTSIQLANAQETFEIFSVNNVKKVFNLK